MPLQLTIPGDIFTAVGLLLDAVGVVFLFWYAPEKIPDPQSAVSFAIEGAARIRWRRSGSLVAQTDRGRPRGWQSGVVPLLCPRRFRRRGWPERDYGPSR